ncbi:MAG: putative cysteine desulfurase 2 [ANME-2 cluster archaeon HR1]|nr:MAG: putative cysteine desulfurase 2 [ANME-2 cluster archaeon HR1]
MRIYMDNASSAPVDKRVIEAMFPYFDTHVGNPTSLHSSGIDARRALENARESVASLIKAQSKEIIFTSGGTESNNIALRGAAQRKKKKGNHIIITAIEHMSVVNTCKDLQREGFEVTTVPVDKYGLVDQARIEAEITNRTIIISCQYANSEIGTIQPIAQIGAMTREQDIIFHVDAVAAAGKIHIDVQQDNIDLLSISSNDLYGPRGVGALYVRSGILLRPVMTGGGQERGLRSGSENIPAIVGMGKACEIIKEEIKSDSGRMESLQERLIEGVLGNMQHAYLTGHRTRRLPHIASYRFSFIEGESIILSLNDLGIEASTGSACSVKTLEPSHVLIAIGLRPEEAHGSLLLSLNRWNTEKEVDYVLESLPLVVDRLRALSPLYNGD